MPDNANLAILERFVTAVFAGDAETILSLCDPDFMLEEGSGLSFAGTYPGGEGFLRFFGIFNQTLEIGHMETLRIYTSQDPNYVISEMELRARVRATGKPFETTMLERWHFRGGKVLSVKPHYFNAM